MDDDISAKAQWEDDGGGCLDLSKSLASIQFKAMGERGVGGEPLLSYHKVMDWEPPQEV